MVSNKFTVGGTPCWSRDNPKGRAVSGEPTAEQSTQVNTAKE